VFFLVAPGTVVGLIPWLLTGGWQLREPVPPYWGYTGFSSQGGRLPFPTVRGNPASGIANSRKPGKKRGPLLLRPDSCF
jgi:hypothetical protein